MEGYQEKYSKQVKLFFPPDLSHCLLLGQKFLEVASSSFRHIEGDPLKNGNYS